MDATERIVLIGFSGTGKTTLARLVAEELGWEAVDVDAEIERSWNATIPAIFRDRGEAAFRERERTILREALRRDRLVIASGGGVPAQPGAWTDHLLGSAGTLVVALDAEPDTILCRLQSQAALAGEAVERPLLAGRDPLERIRGLKSERQGAYDRATIALSTDRISPRVIVEEIVQIALLGHGQPLRQRLEAASGASEIIVAPGVAVSLGHLLRGQWPNAPRVWIISDTNVGPRHAEASAASLREAGFSVDVKFVAAGEGSKSLGTAGDLYDWMLTGGIERSDVVVALGGGVVGDLAGFVAATVLRGVGLVQVPTTLLAAVDSSVGGKTGINHRTGKNLIGAFLQPPLVVVDTSLLHTVPPRELRSGWAEVVKHAIIQHSTPGGERGDLRTLLERNADHLRRMAEPALAYVIWRNIQLKSAVVAADEREAGIRAYLNFGHTLGHAIEAAGYQLLHGEAVALGMRAAAALGVMVGTCGEEEAVRIGRLLSLFELPNSAPLDEELVLERMRSDKKRAGGRQRFVLPLAGGGVGIRDGVPDAAVRNALGTVNRTAVVA